MRRLTLRAWLRAFSTLFTNLTCALRAKLVLCSVLFCFIYIKMRRVQHSPIKTPKELTSPVVSKGSDEFVNAKRGTKNRSDSSPSMVQNPNQACNLQENASNQTAIMSKLLADVVAIKNRMEEVQRANERIEAGMSFINRDFEDFKAEIELLKKERREQKTYIESLEEKLQDLQFKSRSSSVEIKSIPQEDSETPETLAKIVCSIGDTVGSKISQSNLRDIYRLPGKSNAPRPVVAEFSTVDAKVKLLSAVRAYNKNKKLAGDRLNTAKLGFKDSPPKMVNVSERLPSHTKKLLYLASEFKKKNSFAFCWVSNGNIFLRKKQGDVHHLIKSEYCLKMLEKDLEKNI